MSSPVPPTGDAHGSGLLERISNEMVRAQKRFFGKSPEEAKSYLVGDLLVVEMFVFDSPVQRDAREATAPGQTADERIGAATAAEALDAASRAGQ